MGRVLLLCKEAVSVFYSPSRLIKYDKETFLKKMFHSLFISVLINTASVSAKRNILKKINVSLSFISFLVNTASVAILFKHTPYKQQRHYLF